MKTFQILLVLMFVFTACRQASKYNGKMMQMDSSYANDKNATVVKANDTLRITESMKNFEDNPNITKTDIDAGSKTPSAEVNYVKPGDTLRIAEPAKKIK